MEDYTDLFITPCRIGASEAGVALGLSKYATPKSLFEVKSGLIECPTVPSEASSHGLQFEPLIRDWFAKYTNNKIDTCPTTSHPDPSLGQYFSATPDGIITKDSITGEKALLEIKCPYLGSTIDYIPPHYMAQIQMQLEIMDTKFCYLVYYFHLSNEIKIWKVYRSKPYWSWALKLLLKFVDCVERGTPPSKEEIPMICYEAIELAQNDYDFSKIRTTLPRKAFPPKVHTELIFHGAVSSRELLKQEVRYWPSRKVIIIATLVFVGLCAILVAFHYMYNTA